MSHFANADRDISHDADNQEGSGEVVHVSTMTARMLTSFRRSERQLCSPFGVVRECIAESRSPSVMVSRNVIGAIAEYKF